MYARTVSMRVLNGFIFAPVRPAVRRYVVNHRQNNTCLITAGSRTILLLYLQSLKKGGFTVMSMNRWWNINGNGLISSADNSF